MTQTLKDCIYAGNYSSEHDNGMFVVKRCVRCGAILCHLKNGVIEVKTRREHIYKLEGIYAQVTITCHCGMRYVIDL